MTLWEGMCPKAIPVAVLSPTLRICISKCLLDAFRLLVIAWVMKLQSIALGEVW